MSAAELKSILSPALFWSYNYDKLDVDRSWFLVIEHVFWRGNWQEFKAILKYYNKQQLEEVAINSRVLDIKSANFVANFLNIPLQKLKSYNPEKLIDKGVHVF